MATVIVLVAVGGLSQARVSPVDLGEGSQLFRRALSEMGLVAEDVRIDLMDLGFYNRDKYRLQLLEAFFDDPWRINLYTHMLTDQLLAQQGSLPDVLISTQSRINQGVRLTLIGDSIKFAAVKPRRCCP